MYLSLVKKEKFIPSYTLGLFYSSSSPNLNKKQNFPICSQKIVNNINVYLSVPLTLLPIEQNKTKTGTKLALVSTQFLPNNANKVNFFWYQLTDSRNYCDFSILLRALTSLFSISYLQIYFVIFKMFATLQSNCTT